MGAEVSDRDCALALTPVSPEVAARLGDFFAAFETACSQAHARDQELRERRRYRTEKPLLRLVSGLATGTDLLAAEAEAAIYRASMEGLQQHAIGVAVHERGHGRERVLAERVDVLPVGDVGLGDGRCKRLDDFGRQTDGPRREVSSHAEDDFDLHGLMLS